MWICHQLLEIHPHQPVLHYQGSNFGNRVRSVVDGLDFGEQKVSDDGNPQAGLAGILRAYEQVFDREILLYKLEERLNIPLITVIEHPSKGVIQKGEFAA